jgi:hypothetical protein
MTIFTDAHDSDDEHELSSADLDAMLKGHRPLGGAPEAHRVADVMNALTAPAERTELTGYSRAMASYGRAFARPRSRRVAMISSAAGLKALASAAGAAVALGGVATIVFASGAMGPGHPTLVTPVATSATTGAAKTTPSEAEESNTPVGPDASGPAAFGLCNAWTHHQHKDKDKPGNSVAFGNLAEAAGGESKIAAYCAKVPHPGDRDRPTTDPSGRPTSKATGKAPSTPRGKTASTNGTARTPAATPTTAATPAATLTAPTPPTTLPTAP